MFLLAEEILQTENGKRHTTVIYIRVVVSTSDA